jgi:DNA-binding GntR family transcriptional regulator
MVLRLVPITAPLPSNRVGDVIYERILQAIHFGELRPGELLNDQEIARQLGVSRTPVRETLLRLQVMGVVEIAAARYTRVAVVDRKQTVEAVRVWAALYRLVVSEVFPTASAELLERMTAAADRYRELAAQPGGDGPIPTEQSVIANADFFWAPVSVTTNGLLRQAMETAVNVARLGGQALPQRPSRADVMSGHRGILTAAMAHDVTAGHQALEEILGIKL